MCTHSFCKAFIYGFFSSLVLATLARSLPARGESWSGTNVHTSAYGLPCTVSLDRDGDGNVKRITVSGAARRVSHWSEPKTEVTGSTITVGEHVTSPELHSFQSFASVPSIAHPGMTRMGLQILTGNLDHPWPGVQDVRYVVRNSDFTEVIAKSEIYMMLRVIPLGSDTIHCRDLHAD